MQKKVRDFMSLFIYLFVPISMFAADLDGLAYNSLTEDGAWCWFSDPRAVQSKGFVYTGFVNSHGDIVITKMDVKTGGLEEKVLYPKYEKDDHANPSILIRNDGHVMVFVTSHGDKVLNVFISEKPRDISLWQSVVQQEYKKVICYTNPVQLSKEKNRIYLFFRNIDWKPSMIHSDDGGLTWSEAVQLVDSPGARPYMKVVSDGKDQIHFAFTTGHPRDEAQNTVFHMVYKKGGLYKTDGSFIKKIEDLPVHIDEASVVYNAKKTDVRAWIWDIALDKKNRPIIAYTRLPQEKEHHYHYAQWDGKKWNDAHLCEAGSWFPETQKYMIEREPHYSGGIALNHEDPNICYVSKQVEGIFEIEKWSKDEKSDSWKSEALTQGSTLNNVRPFVIRNHDKEKPHVLWMVNEKYVHYTDYKSQIKMDIPMKPVDNALDPASVAEITRRVADWQIVNPYKKDIRDWTQGAYLIGMAAWAHMAQDPKYYDYLLSLGNDVDWTLYKLIYHADDHAIGWVWEEMYDVFKCPKMIQFTRERFDYILANRPNTPLTHDNWDHKKRYNWCDALFMAPPVWLKLAQITGDTAYSNYAHKEFKATTDYLYNKKEHLYYRDDRYFDQREANGENIYWSRGNGWVIAGIARILSILPDHDPHRAYYEKIFIQMAAKLKAIQPEDGLWRASLLDPESYPLPETSGTGFYCFSMAWGINNGLLDRDEYLPAVQKAWEGLVSYVQTNGKLTHVQPIGADPKSITPDMTGVWGVSGFLLSGSEVYKLFKFDGIEKSKITVQNTLAQFYDSETIEVAVEDNKDYVLFDTKKNKFVPTQKLDIDGKTYLIFQTHLAPGGKNIFWLSEKQKGWDVPELENKAHAMFVPQRKDDFAWENDRIAFRMYGPALQAQNEISSGVDVWVKSVRYPILQKWYDMEDYHNEHGEGLDYYKVGPSRGCGGLGIWKDNQLYVSKNYTDWKILANGPIRTVFELTYAPWEAGDLKVKETKHVTLDLGSNLNKFESRFEILSGDKNADIAVGIVRRGEGGDVDYNQSEGWMTYWEPAHPQNQSTGCGVLVPEFNQMVDDGEQLFLIKESDLSKPFIYYTGACWEKGLDFKNSDTWTEYVKEAANRVVNPVEVVVE